MDGVPGTVYLVCFERPFGHARHYTGWAEHLERRIAHHRSGTGALLLRYVNAAGIGWAVARTMPGTKHDERRIKNAGGMTRYCPRCHPSDYRNGVWKPWSGTSVPY